MIKPKHLKKKIQGDYRMIVVSDIHGHLDRFQSLLEKVHYTSDDYLVILGDFVEKGDQVIDTIHYIQNLDRNDRVFVLAGNCEWALSAMLEVPEMAAQIPMYFQRISANGSIRDVYHLLHLDDGHETTLGVQKKIAEYLKDELKYISHLPVTLKMNQFLFVHAGVEYREDYQNTNLKTLLSMQHFYDQGHPLEEIVIVGHIPTANYYLHHIDNRIIIDLDKKIISIDGGTGVKPVSQLNALIIQCQDNEITYETDYVQPLPTAIMNKDIANKNQKTHKIAFPSFQVDIIEKGEQFSLCQQVDTNEIFPIKNEFLYERNHQTYCLDDYTDYMLSGKKGDILKVIGIYDEYVYAICNEKVGWIKLKNVSMKSPI